MNPIACIVLSAFAFLASASLVQAQQGHQPKRVGFASFASPATAAPFIAELRQGLREHGWVEGQNIVIEPRYAEGKLERLAEIAAELVRLPLDVLVTGGVPPTLALKKATQTIPIVVAAATDPAGTGLVTAGGNVAAFDVLPPDAAARQLEVLREVVSGLSRMALVWNDSNPAAQVNARRAREAAQAAGLHVIPIAVQGPGEIDGALAGLRGKGAQAVFLVADADAGCVVSYGANLLSMYRQSASYVDRILKGARPDDLPIGPPTRFDLVIHAGSAKAMGLTIPPSVIKRADAVVE